MPLPALPLGRPGTKKLLFYAESPVKYAMFRPLHQRLAQDPRIQVYFAGKLRGSQDSRSMARTLGIEAIKPLRRGISVLHRFDLLITADYELWRGYENPLFPASHAPRLQIFHGASVRNGAVAPKMAQFRHLFLIGPYMKRAFERAGFFASGGPMRHDVGMPKTDRLLNGTLDAGEIRDALRLETAHPTVMLAPTWLHKSPLELYGDDLLEELARGPWNLLVKLHDKFFDPRFNVISWGAKLAALESRHANVRIVRDYDAIPALFVTDLLISDVSSISNEFALLDRPIVYLQVPDVVDLKRRYQSLDLDTWGQNAGETVNGAAACRMAVERGLADPSRHGATRRALAADIFFHPGRATDAAMRALATVLDLDGSTNRALAAAGAAS